MIVTLVKGAVRSTAVSVEVSRTPKTSSDGSRTPSLLMLISLHPCPT